MDIQNVGEDLRPHPFNLASLSWLYSRLREHDDPLALSSRMKVSLHIRAFQRLSR